MRTVGQNDKKWASVRLCAGTAAVALAVGCAAAIGKRYGTRPALFRPPYGNYDEDSLRAARSCGVKYVPLWNEEVFADHWDYREGDRDVHPGDIVLSHFRGRDDGKGTMPDVIRHFMKLVTAKGYAVARLEDYL